MEASSCVTPDGVLIITFSGTYPDGSAGNPVAEWMVATGEELLRQHRPQGLVVDLRDLWYRWGDLIEWIYDIGRGADPPISQATVVSRKNRRALSTLEFGERTRKDITDLEEVFDGLEAAVAHLRDRMP